MSYPDTDPADRYVAHSGYEMRPGVQYDYADPRTGLFGQCERREDGTWRLELRGEEPVVLEYQDVAAKRFGDTRRSVKR